MTSGLVLLDPQPLDESQREKLVQMLFLGIDRAAAARYLGISEGELHRLERRDPTLRESLLDAERLFEMSRLSQLARLSDKHWHAAAWLLERRFPLRYARGADRITARQARSTCQEFVDLILKAVPEEFRRDGIERSLRRSVDCDLFSSENAADAGR